MNWSYVPLQLAAEHQQPMTAAEHANWSGHAAEFIRDVPSSCTGAWKWEPVMGRYALIGHGVSCPWHSGTGEQ